MIDKQKERAERAFELKKNAYWQDVIERHLFTEVLDEQNKLITQLCANPENSQYKSAIQAKKAIEWFKNWIDDLANSSNDLSSLDSPNSNVTF